jgi:hypothetical protein
MSKRYYLDDKSNTAPQWTSSRDLLYTYTHIQRLLWQKMETIVPNSQTIHQTLPFQMRLESHHRHQCLAATSRLAAASRAACASRSCAHHAVSPLPMSLRGRSDGGSLSASIYIHKIYTIYTHIYTYIHIYTNTYICIYTHTYTYTYTYMYIHTYIYAYLFLYMNYIYSIYCNIQSDFIIFSLPI